jgi:hypothetical protein
MFPFLRLWKKDENKTQANVLQGDTVQGESKVEASPNLDEHDVNAEGWTRRERYCEF